MIEKIFTANKDLKSMRDVQWTLTVINTPLTNSYILPVRTSLVLYTNIFNVQMIFIYFFFHFIYLYFFYLSRVEIFLYPWTF